MFFLKKELQGKSLSQKPKGAIYHTGRNNQHLFFNIKTPDEIEIKTAKKGDVFLFEKEIFHRFEVMEDSIWLNVCLKKLTRIMRHPHF